MLARMATKAEASAWITSWENAQNGLLLNSSYTVTFPDGTTRTITRADRDDIRQGITYWNRVYNALDAAERGAKEKGYSTPSFY